MTTRVLLYSGGLDSFCTAQLIDPEVALYVDTRSHYSRFEIENLASPPKGRLLIAPGIVDLSAYERDDSIVPGRNAFMVLVASQYGDEVALAATAGDLSSDKDMPWAVMMSGLLHHMYATAHGAPPGRVGFGSVTLPVKHLGKPALVAAYLAAGGDGAVLDSLVSCYSGTSRHCGACKPCARKWVALAANGIPCRMDRDPRIYFEDDPRLLQRLTENKWRGPEEDPVTLRVLRESGF